MFKNLKKFVQNLQTAEEKRKKRWLFILSGLAMILVVSGWIFYINKTIVNLGAPAVTEKKTSAEPTKESFLQVFSTGIKTITDQIKDLIQTTREISIEQNSPDTATSSEEILNASSSNATSSPKK